MMKGNKLSEQVKVACKLKQTLTKIKEIAEEIFKTKEWVNCKYNALKANQILQKINEVLDEN